VLIGYLCDCPGDDADAAAQRRALTDAGCEQVVEERPGVEHGDEQPELRAFLARLQAGDVVVIPHLDTLGSSPPKVVQRAQQLAAAGIGLRSLAEAFDSPALPRPGGMVSVGGQGDSQDAGSVRRGAGGRPPKLSPSQQADVVENVLSGRHTAAAWPSTTASTPPRSAGCWPPDGRVLRRRRRAGLQGAKGRPRTGSLASCPRPPWTGALPSWAPLDRARPMRPRA